MVDVTNIGVVTIWYRLCHIQGRAWAEGEMFGSAGGVGAGYIRGISWSSEKLVLKETDLTRRTCAALRPCVEETRIAHKIFMKNIQGHPFLL